jgi:hypothetical protein
MKTAIIVPAGWVVDEDAATVAPPGADGALIVEIEPPRPAPLDTPAFLRELAARVEPGQQAGLRASTTGETACGWPLDRLELMVTDAAGRPVEGRVIAVCRFLGYVAVITVRARSQAALVAARPELEALFASARPDWRGDQVAALVDLWAD